MSLCLNLTRNFSLWCPNQNVSGVPENTPAFHQVFLRSKPRFRGIAQIVLAIFQLAFGIVLNFFGGKIYTLYSYIIFWGPPFLIISGVLAVVAHRVASSKLVRVCYIFHTISILISLTGLVLACIDAFNIYPCGATCGNLPAMTVTGFGAMASMLHLLPMKILDLFSQTLLHILKQLSMNHHHFSNLRHFCNLLHILNFQQLQHHQHFVKWQIIYSHHHTPNEELPN
ncbi:uncharacterized protein LOC143764883 isoform X3 [Ranitomeya variabilis]|uniref:uncharacterized protein LOC143764883 isoform X3 n=1 Tax=Ranitomeya variabilis TaxID=490064 RepID=UPI0040571D5B